MLRDSGVIEEAADFVLGAWRPEKARDLSPADALSLRDVLRLAILKNRKGPEAAGSTYGSDPTRGVSTRGLIRSRKSPDGI